MEQQEKVFVYFEITKEFIFTDAIRQKYGKMSYPELQACLMPNGVMSVKKTYLLLPMYLMTIVNLP